MSTKRKVGGLLPGQVTGLGCRFGPRLEHVQETTDGCLSLTSTLLSLSSSLPLLSKKKKCEEGGDHEGCPTQGVGRGISWGQQGAQEV